VVIQSTLTSLVSLGAIRISHFLLCWRSIADAIDTF
jgi:hypothetical protein